MKRKIHAPDSKPITPAPAKSPYAKTSKPFNAWAEHLVGAQGVPTVPEVKKRKAPEGDIKTPAGPEEREVLYDGVRFTARRDGAEGAVEIVDIDNVGKGEGGFPVGKVFKFTIAKTDGAFDGEKELGADFDFGSLKAQLMPVCKPAFIQLLPESRVIAPLPSGSSAKPMDVDVKPSEFPARLTAPPTIGSAADSKPDVKPKGNQPYPAKGQASFKDTVTDEMLATIKEKFGVWEGRKVEWTRVTGAFLWLGDHLSR